MSLLAFTPPAWQPPQTNDLMARFRALEHYLLHQFLPYLFNYLPERDILDSVLFNQPLVPATDGATTHFALAIFKMMPPGAPILVPSRIRLGVDGTPQAALQLGTTMLEYTASPTPGANEWTVIDTPSGTGVNPQEVIVGTPPGAGAYFRFAVAVLA